MMHSTRGAFAGWLMVTVVFSGDAQAQTVTSNQPVAAAFGNLGTVISPGERVVLTTTDGTTLRGALRDLVRRACSCGPVTASAPSATQNRHWFLEPIVGDREYGARLTKAF